MRRDPALLPIIEAWLKGKEIEVHSAFSREWELIKHTPTFDYPASHYRIKQEPKYRPYRTIEEAKHLMGSVIKHKERESYEMVTNITKNETRLYINGTISRSTLEYFESITGQPLGVKE